MSGRCSRRKLGFQSVPAFPKQAAPSTRTGKCPHKPEAPTRRATCKPISRNTRAASMRRDRKCDRFLKVRKDARPVAKTMVAAKPTVSAWRDAVQMPPCGSAKAAQMEASSILLSCHLLATLRKRQAKVLQIEVVVTSRQNSAACLYSIVTRLTLRFL